MDAPEPVDELRDELPDDLDPTGFVGAYRFPDNSRRRIPGVIYLVIAAACLGVALLGDGSPLVNGGILWAAVVLGVMGAISITSGWRMNVDEQAALALVHVYPVPAGHPWTVERMRTDDLGHVGTILGQRPSTYRPGDHGAKIENLESLER